MKTDITTKQNLVLRCDYDFCCVAPLVIIKYRSENPYNNQSSCFVEFYRQLAFIVEGPVLWMW